MRVYGVVNTKLAVCLGDSQLAATSEAQSVPASGADSSQAWNPYHIAQQHGATDATDGSQIQCSQPYGISY